MTFTYLLGRVYWQLAMRKGPLNWRLIVKNMTFLLRHIPFAARRAETYFEKAIAMAESINAKGVAGQIYFDMAQLHDRLNKKDAARRCINRSIALFQDCEADVHLETAMHYAREHHLNA